MPAISQPRPAKGPVARAFIRFFGVIVLAVGVSLSWYFVLETGEHASLIGAPGTFIVSDCHDTGTGRSRHSECDGAFIPSGRSGYADVWATIDGHDWSPGKKVHVIQGPAGYAVPGIASTVGFLALCGLGVTITSCGFLMLFGRMGAPSGAIRGRIADISSRVVVLATRSTLLCGLAALVIWLVV